MKKSFLIFFLLLFGFAAEAWAQEWVPTNGPGGRFDQLLFNQKKDMFLSYGTIMRSTDGGKSWVKIAPQQTPLTTGWKVAIAPNQDIYLAGGSNDSTKIWESTDNGDTWNGMWLNNIVVENILVSPDNTIYILGTQPDTTLGAFYKSDDLGKTWKFNMITINGHTIVPEKGRFGIYPRALIMCGLN